MKEGAPPLRAAVDPLADPLDLCVIGVHARIDVGVTAVDVALVVHEALGVARVDPLGHGGEPAPGARLVAEGPQNDGRMVLVALDHAGRPVEQCGGPALVVDRVVAPALFAEAVGLQVALVDDPQPVLVAEGEEGGVRRIVGGADGVDVVGLQQLDVAAHGFEVERAAVLRVPLVPVDALEEDRRAVDLDEAVRQLHGTEADAQRHPLTGRRELAVVQARRLGRPRLDGDGHRLPGGRVNTQLRHGDPPLHVTVDAERAEAGGVVVRGVREEVPGAADGAVQERHVAEDAGQPPLVLVLQVGARGPLVHADREHVAGGGEEVADLELVRQPAPLELAELRAVQPHLRAGLHPVEADHGRAVTGPVAGQVEDAQVIPGRVLVGNARRVDGERIEDVRIGRRPERPVPLHHPVPGHGDATPAAGVVPRGGEGVVVSVGPRRQPETPSPVERE